MVTAELGIEQQPREPVRVFGAEVEPLERAGETAAQVLDPHDVHARSLHDRPWGHRQIATVRRHPGDAREALRHEADGEASDSWARRSLQAEAIACRSATRTLASR